MLVLPTGIFAFAAGSNDGETVNLSVYEQVNGKYLYWDTALEITDENTLLELLNQGGVASQQKDGVITIGNFADNDAGNWAMLVNDNRQIADLNYKPQSSDRIKLIYELKTQPVTSGTTANTAATSPTSTILNTTAAVSGSENTLASPSSSEATSAQSSTEITSSTAETSSAASNNTVNTDKTQPTEESTVSNSEMISNAVDYIAANGGDFTPLALKCYNYRNNSELQKKLNAEVQNSSSLKMYDLSRIIINSAAVQLDLTNVGGANLENLLKNNENVMSSGLHGIVFALLALKHCKTDDEYINTPDILYELILQNQNTDGGFAKTYGEKSDVYLTATALIALSDYNSTPAVKTASEKAILWLLNSQNDDGSFDGENGKPDCSATAQVIIALRAQDISIDDERFIKQRSVYDSLSDFYNGTAFADSVNGESSSKASETALLAFYSCNNTANPYTAKISSINQHFGGIILFGGAFVVLIASGVMLLIMKKRDKSAKQNDEPTENKTENTNENEKSRKEK